MIETTDKTLVKVVPQPHGGALRQGPNNGNGGGRPPDEFRAMCRRLACSAESVVEQILADKSHPAFNGALKWASEHGYGRPKESLEVTGKLEVNQLWTFGDKPVKF